MKTAIDWLVEQIENHTGVTRKGFEYVINEAKEIERNQIIRAVNYSVMNCETLRKKAITERITIGEVYVKMNLNQSK